MHVHPQNRILIQGGRVVDPSQAINSVKDVFIENDTIVAIGDKPESFKPDTTINAKGHIITPGFIDLCAFLAEPGFGQKGTLASETTAAAQSGITTLCCTPNTKPVLDSAAVANLIKDKSQEAAKVKVLPLGALTSGLEGQQLANMSVLKDAGCIALTNLQHPFKDNRVIMQCYHYAAGIGIPVHITPLDQSLANDGCMHEGATSTQLGLAGIPETAETLALAQHLLLIEQTGVQAHFSRISTARSLEMIMNAKDRGLPITADVAIGNLYFTDEDSLNYASAMHVTPPYRTEDDRKALLNGVNSGYLSICSNHTPHEIAAKMAPYAATEPGVSTLDSFTSVLFTLISNGALNQKAAISAVTLLPAKVIEQNQSTLSDHLGTGTLANGCRADICIIDLEHEWQLSEERLFSKGPINPWIGQTLKGQVATTIVNGQIIFQRQGCN